MRIKLPMVTVLFLLLFLQQSVMAMPQVQTTVSDNSVFLGDLFTLTITVDDNDSDFQLDTKPLEKEFSVSRPSQSRSSTYINGKSSEQTQWQITLQARHIGELTIPALKIGSLTTKALKISVRKPSQQATKTPDNLIFMENSLNKKSVYLEQPLILTSKIYIARNSSELELVAPDLPGATVTVYGEDKNGETIRNGIRYQTITRRFQISAQKAGSFTINSPLLTGNLHKTIQISNWQNRVISNPINIRGDSLQVEIKAKPANYQGEWLISEKVRLIEDPALNQHSYHVGDPITRNITLQAASVTPEKLPKLNFNYPKNLRFYPDQDELTAAQTDGLIYAVRKMRHAIIADHAGKLTLPEIKLAWWNSQSDKQEFAVLPAQTLTILAAEQQPLTTASNPPTSATADKTEPAAPAIVADDTLILWQVVSALLLLTVIMLIFYHLSYRRAQRANKVKNSSVIHPSNQAYLSLQQALKKSQATQIYQALLNYAQSEFPALTSLSQLAAYMCLDEQDKKQLLSEIAALEKACALPAPIWESVLLNRLIKKHRHQKTLKPDDNIMNLNPF